MKRLYRCLIAVLAVLSLSCPVLADVAFMPNDSFLSDNYDKTEHFGAYCYINSPEGYTTVWDTPEAGKSLDTIKNGEVLYVTATYEDWGVVEYSVDEDGNYTSYWPQGETKTGWIVMSDTVKKYDNSDFLEEFGGEITQNADAQNALIGYEVKNAIQFYTYPGSGEVQDTLDAIDPEYGELTFSDIYTDPEGRVWGYCGYYMQLKGWVCIDDPENAEIPMFIDRSPELISAADPSADPQKPEEAKPSTMRIIWLIVVFVLISFLAMRFVVNNATKKRYAEKEAAERAEARKNRKKKR